MRWSAACRCATLVLLGAVVLSPKAFAQVAITEVMYAPNAPEPEWIELYNPGSAAVDLTDWTLHDATAARPRFPSFLLAGGGFVVVTKDSSALRTARPGSYPILQISLPAFNNDGDEVILRDTSGAAIDSLHYLSTWGGGEGRSLERKDASSPATSAASWESATEVAGATPGRKNSISLPDLNLSVVSARFDPATAAVVAQIANSGRGTVSAGEARLLYLGQGTPPQELAKQSLGTMNAGASQTLTLQWTRTLTEQGETGAVEVVLPGDERSSDNVQLFIARLAPLDTGLRITEVMNDPLTIDGTTTAEYVELFNPLDRPVAVANWKLFDATAKAVATLPDTAPDVAPHRYLVIASDTTIYHAFPFLRDSSNVVVIGKQSFGLNLDADQVVVRNAGGATVDSIFYWSDWWGPDVQGTRGISLERISVTGPSTAKSNWSGSVNRDGGTPGRENSRAIPVEVSTATLTASPATISPDGDGRDDFTRISFRLPVATARIVLQVYDRAGRPMVRIANNETSPPNGEITWDGYGQDRLPLPFGVYVVRLDAYNASGGTTTTAQTTVVVAKKL